MASEGEEGWAELSLSIPHDISEASFWFSVFFFLWTIRYPMHSFKQMIRKNVTYYNYATCSLPPLSLPHMDKLVTKPIESFFLADRSLCCQ